MRYLTLLLLISISCNAAIEDLPALDAFTDKKLMELALIGGLGVLSLILINIPVAYLATNMGVEIKNKIDGAGINTQIFQHLFWAFVILNLSFIAFEILTAVLDSVMPKYAPASDLIKEFWTLDENLKAVGRNVELKEKMISGIADIRELGKLTIYITNIVVIFASISLSFSAFTFSSKIGIQVLTSLVFGFIAAQIIMMLWASVGNLITYNEIDILAIFREYVQAGIKEISGEEIF